MNKMKRAFVLPMLSLCCIAIAGCDAGKKTGNKADENKGPDNYADAVAEVGKLAEQIKNASDKDDLGAAHDQLHEIGHIILDIKEFVVKESMPADKVAEINTAAEQLMEQFAALDEQMHSAKARENPVTYADLADKIDAAMKVLNDAL